MNSSEKIKKFLLDNLTNHQKDIIHTAINQFGLSRQAIHKHMNSLINEKKVIGHGTTKGRYYELIPSVNYSKSFDIQINNNEKLITKYVIPHFSNLPKNIHEIFEFTAWALINNIYDHANASRLYLKIFINHNEAHFIISDNGIGIFKHIKRGLRLTNDQLAALELTKGNLKVEPDYHSGDELYAVIHLFDKVKIESSGKSLKFLNSNQEWEIGDSSQTKGSRIHLIINPSSARTCADIINQIFKSNKEKIRIPLNLLDIANHNIVNSRDQVGSVLRNIKDYKNIEFDFKKINLIGPAFADALIHKTIEKNQHANIKWINSNETVDLLLSRALGRQS